MLKIEPIQTPIFVQKIDFEKNLQNLINGKEVTLISYFDFSKIAKLYK